MRANYIGIAILLAFVKVNAVANNLIIHPLHLSSSDSSHSLRMPATGSHHALKVTISEDDSKQVCDWPGDCLKLVIRNGKDEAIMAQYQFESSYGNWVLYVYDVTGDGEEEYILITGKNHGTSVVEESIHVLSRIGSSFIEILDTPISGYAGSINAWVYDIAFLHHKGQKKATIALTLDRSWILTTDNQELVPKVTYQEFQYDSTKHKMVLTVAKSK